MIVNINYYKGAKILGGLKLYLFNIETTFDLSYSKKQKINSRGILFYHNVKNVIEITIF